ncbi:unnamed protein product [Durusdinium trenchii]|uniref:Uncharacterized protein n=1 Tax=Durusdinium trenchii TaxID=1381693 RepID=A0ABP0K2E1_9DINO
MQYLGAGQGAYEREVVKTYGSYRCRPWCMVMPCLLLILPIGMLFWHFWPRAQHNPPDCITDFHDWLRLWTEERKAYCCKTAGRACGAQQGVYRTPPVVYRGASSRLAVWVDLRGPRGFEEAAARAVRCAALCAVRCGTGATVDGRHVPKGRRFLLDVCSASFTSAPPLRARHGGTMASPAVACRGTGRVRGVVTTGRGGRADDGVW